MRTLGQKSGGTGEAGVYVRSAASYHQEVKPRDIIKIVTPMCERFEVPVPDFEIRPSAKRVRGKYYYDRELIALYLPVTQGVLYHELAHHINWKKYDGMRHTWTFKNILNRIFDIMSI